MDLIRVEYIPDEQSDIASTLLRLKERVGPNGVIFTSGGIGPTHDDITYESIAHAFGMYQQLTDSSAAASLDANECRSPHDNNNSNTITYESIAHAFGMYQEFSNSSNAAFLDAKKFRAPDEIPAQMQWPGGQSCFL